MALIKCKGCGKEMSSLAVACPACGAKPDSVVSETYFDTRAFLLIILLMLAGWGLTQLI